eukprot:3981-Pyramimonas_sp.AAC.1
MFMRKHDRKIYESPALRISVPERNLRSENAFADFKHSRCFSKVLCVVGPSRRFRQIFNANAAWDARQNGFAESHCPPSPFSRGRGGR